jgi:hypothetical protein
MQRAVVACQYVRYTSWETAKNIDGKREEGKWLGSVMFSEVGSSMLRKLRIEAQQVVLKRNVNKTCLRGRREGPHWTLLQAGSAHPAHRAGSCRGWKWLGCLLSSAPDALQQHSYEPLLLAAAKGLAGMGL